ncbi:S-adenosylmethionine transporter [Serendipita sp. 396]|nr:S-adenosylmethionine transporter [Serendipita sp. 396]KAG8789905.1 S-adenosylmethionine transporter [Serendipita sp. 397]KAG8804761.1 S-adenosylmethionine transporter [Serendipita sp. 398]KAG8825921.1 S-adenosylmethionine transporter [Serendipita sp. 401]KAG8836609.1 S-adenosylmethionine transporter [Serendipita sp. 400]KAG8872950.1 S-adenosylmethionine transporter [Serendipita sp. 405]KAG9055817.1 S-adenosylmethionine transporter [Serendipita sp. 407]
MPPAFTDSLIAGGVAGTSVDLLFFPIDTLKTRLQSSQGFIKAGGFKGVYKGVGSVALGSAPGAAAFFTTYDTLKKTIKFAPGWEPLTHLVSASCGEVVACIIRVPTEVVKSRTQTSSYGPLASSFMSARMTLRTQGWRGFYKGFGLTIMREIPFTSIQFPVYEFLKIKLADALGRERGKLHAYEAAMCGSVAGGLAAASTTPLDVLKTRVMLDIKASTVESSTSPIAMLQRIYRQEGVRALFSGILPRTIWISAGGAVFLGAYEWTIGILQRT